jgi:cell division protein FtsW
VPKRKGKITIKNAIDSPLFLAWMLLVGFGLIMIASAGSIKAHNEFIDASGRPNDYWYLTRQGIWIVVSTVALIISANIDYRQLRYLAFPLLVLEIGFLALPFFGPEILGAKRWIFIGPLSIQPSEVAKVVLAIYLATWLERKGKEVKDFKYGFVPFAALVGIIVVLLQYQRDLGTTIIIFAMAVTVFFVSGANIPQLILGMIVSIAVVGLLIYTTQFRIGRVQAWLDPQASEIYGYHLIRAEYAIGSGGFWGVGYGHSREKYEWLPHAPTDSIFAVIGEELGLVGTTTLVGLYLFMLYRIFYLALRIKERFGQLLTIALGMWIGIQAFINIGGLLRIIPLTGVPLPFISYGGSSLLMCSIAIGLILSISRQINKDEYYARSADRRRDRRTRLTPTSYR